MERQFLLAPLSSHGTFAITDLHAATIWSYLQEPLPLEIPSGTIAVKGEYNFDIPVRRRQSRSTSTTPP